MALLRPKGSVLWALATVVPVVLLLAVFLRGIRGLNDFERANIENISSGGCVQALAYIDKFDQGGSMSKDQYDLIVRSHKDCQDRGDKLDAWFLR